MARVRRGFVGDVHRLRDIRGDAKRLQRGSRDSGGFSEQLQDAAVANSSFALDYDLVEVRFGCEPVAVAFLAHVPKRPGERVAHVFDVAPRQTRPADADEHLGRGGSQHPVGAEAVEERRRGEPYRGAVPSNVSSASLVFLGSFGVASDDVSVQRRLVGLPGGSG